MAKKFALHPGYITSKSDGDRHYIGVRQLERLYELKQSEYIVWDDAIPALNRGRRWNDYVHLYPNYNGDYGRPDAQG